MKTRLALLLLLAACAPEDGDEAQAEDFATGAEAAILSSDASVYRFTNTVPRCGTYAHDEDYSSGRYDAHRYSFTVEANTAIELHLQTTAGTWEPALIVATTNGEKLYDGERALEADSAVTITPLESGRSGDTAKVIFESTTRASLYAYATSWAMIDAAFAGGIPRSAEYTITIAATCARSDWSSIHRGLDLEGSHVPRAGLANSTLRRALGVSVEPYGRVVSHQNLDFVSGTISHFGGPNDTGVTSTETGAITGERLRSLNSPLHPSQAQLDARPEQYYYAAMRFDYAQNGRTWWAGARLLIVSPSTERAIVVRPVDWGPNTRTRRLIDLSPQSMVDLGLDTDDTVYVSFADPSAPLGLTE